MLKLKFSGDLSFPFFFVFQEIRKRGLKVAVAGIPKTIDNDIPVPVIYHLIHLYACHFFLWIII